MNKKDFLTALSKYLNELDQYTKEDLLEYYEGIIDEELSEGKALVDILDGLGSPKELSNKILTSLKNGDNVTRPIDISIEEANYVNQNAHDVLPNSYEVNKIKTEEKNPSTNGEPGFIHTREKKQNSSGKRSKFWSIYFIFGIITIPITLAFAIIGLALSIVAFVLVLALGLVSWVIALVGIIGVVYGIVVGIMGNSLMAAFSFAGAGLIVFALGCFLSYLNVKLFKSARIRRKKGVNK